jgi:hypothetical protein
MTGKQESPAESIVREIKRQTRRKFTAEEKIRIVLEGLRGEAGITDLCRIDLLWLNVPPGKRAFQGYGLNKLVQATSLRRCSKQDPGRVAGQET